MKVYVVLEEDRGCGVTVCGVYLKEQDAINYVDGNSHYWYTEEEVQGLGDGVTCQYSSDPESSQVGEEDKVAQDDIPMGIVAYHAKTKDLVLYHDPDGYWIGAFSPHTAQHSGISYDPYLWVKGNYVTLEEGMAALAECTGDEF